MLHRALILKCNARSVISPFQRLINIHVLITKHQKLSHPVRSLGLMTLFRLVEVGELPLPSEGLTLGVLRGADGTVALQSHRVVVQGRHVGLAAWQPGRHVAGPTVRTDAVVALDVGRVGHRFLQGSHRWTQVTELPLIHVSMRSVFNTE